LPVKFSAGVDYNVAAQEKGARRTFKPVGQEGENMANSTAHSRRFGRWASLALVAFLAGGGGGIVSAAALECPVPQKLAQPGVLQETQAQIDKVAAQLAAGGSSVDVTLKAIIADLRARYPHVENAEIANYLISAYCPVAARSPGASDGEKKLQLDQFVSLLMGMLY
jgi:hypothetical protein